MYRCPECGDAEGLQVQVRVWANLVQRDDKPWSFETHTDPINVEHDWDDNDMMICEACGHSEDAGFFHNSEPPAGCLGCYGKEEEVA